MAQQEALRQFDPHIDHAGLALCDMNAFVVADKDYFLLTVQDFPPSDPWSEVYREQLEELGVGGFFQGREVWELGVGDGRNALYMIGARRVKGIDVGADRLALAAENFRLNQFPVQENPELYHMSALEFIASWKAMHGPDEKFSGRIVMCLPQSPKGENVADAYQQEPGLKKYTDRWEKYGLTLNAAVLDNLREIVSEEARVIIILAGRSPHQARVDLLRDTGWIMGYRFAGKVQQDPDTGVGWVKQVDDGKRFFERIGDKFMLISAAEAEKRRLESVLSGRGRDFLNVWHEVNVMIIRPRRHEDDEY